MKKVAVLVDGGFYRKGAKHLWGEKSPEQRCEKLIKYCRFHLKERDNFVVEGDKRIYQYNELYRIFYYDCEPLKKTVYNPLTQKNFDFAKSPTFVWMNTFLSNLKQRRKVALRMGFFADEESKDEDLPYAKYFTKAVKKLCKGSLKIEDLSESDLVLNMRQKGVDMKIGLDIASLAYKKLADQIVLISGDSDFVPAAKLARVEGIDFIVDSMGMKINDNLIEHIDGLRSYYKRFGASETDRE